MVVAVAAVSAFVAGEATAPYFLEQHLHHMGAFDQTVPEDVAMLADLAAQYRSAFTQSLLWAVAAATLAATGVGLFVTARIVGPLRAMRAASHRIAGGRYEGRLDAAAPGEIGALARSFNTMAAALEESESRRHQLVADLAHEIRTPLSNLRGYLEGVEDGVFNVDVETTGSMRRQITRLERLVGDLGLLSRLDERGVSVHPVLMPVREVLTASVAAFRARFEAREVRLEVDEVSEAMRVRVDPERIAQVLENVLGNALRYSSPGQAVEVGARAEGASVRVEVRDRGPGVPPAMREAIFRRFVRVDPARSPHPDAGSGLGLTIAKELVERHGGEIGMEARTGGGSVFWFSLPRAEAPAAPASGGRRARAHP
jgi:signal transduction histidine kinase